MIAITAKVRNAAALNVASVLTFQLCHEKAASYIAAIDQHCSTMRFASRRLCTLAHQIEVHQRSRPSARIRVPLCWIDVMVIKVHEMGNEMGITRVSRGRRRELIAVISILTAIAGLFIDLLPVSAASNNSSFGPSHFAAEPLTYATGDNPKSLNFGTPVSLSGSPTSVARNRLIGFQAKRYLGNVGWALASLGQGGNGYEYPLYSTNHGATWVTDGPYFHGPWADAPDWAGAIQAYTAKFAVAYTRGGQTLYVTDDGGHHWYASLAFSSIVSVSHSVSPTPIPGVGTIRVAVSMTGNAPAKYVFTSSDGGRNWVRHAA